MLLDLINQANDIKKLSEEDYIALAQEIRDFLIHKIMRYNVIQKQNRCHPSRFQDP